MMMKTKRVRKKSCVTNIPILELFPILIIISWIDSRSLLSAGKKKKEEERENESATPIVLQNNRGFSIWSATSSMWGLLWTGCTSLSRRFSSFYRLDFPSFLESTVVEPFCGFLDGFMMRIYFDLVVSLFLFVWYWQFLGSFLRFWLISHWLQFKAGFFSSGTWHLGVLIPPLSPEREQERMTVNSKILAFMIFCLFSCCFGFRRCCAPFEATDESNYRQYH